MTTRTACVLFINRQLSAASNNMQCIFQGLDRALVPVRVTSNIRLSSASDDTLAQDEIKTVDGTVQTSESIL